MRVFLDECVDRRLAREIVGREVRTARQLGWATIKNGELLAFAAREFDRNLSFQQNVTALSIAVIVLHARSNRLADLRPLVAQLLAAIASAAPGSTITAGTP